MGQNEIEDCRAFWRPGFARSRQETRKQNDQGSGKEVNARCKRTEAGGIACLPNLKRTILKPSQGGALSECRLVHFLSAGNKPNGFMMHVKAPTVENLIHWHYMISAEGGMIQFMGLSFRTEVHVPLSDTDDGGTVPALVEALKTDIKANQSHYAEIQRSFEKWSLLINPFSRINKIVDTYIERLKDLKVTELAIPARPKNEEEMLAVQSAMKKCWDVYHEANAIGTSIKLMLPVLGEAFVNLLIFALSKEELPGGHPKSPTCGHLKIPHLR
jgi:hypothetical protein